MALKTIAKFKYWCIEEAKFYEGWFEKPPLVCPTNASHTVDSNKTEILDRILGDTILVIIQDEPDESTTGGNFAVKTLEVTDIPAEAGWHEKDFSFPFPVTIRSLEWDNVDYMLNDILQIHVKPDAALGNILSDLSADSDVISLSDASIDLLKLGYGLILDDGTNKEDLGHLINIDTVAKTVKTEKKTVNAFTAVTPTLATFYQPMISHALLSGDHRIQINRGKSRGLFLLANEKLRIRYNNVDGVANKKFIPWVEFIY